MAPRRKKYYNPNQPYNPQSDLYKSLTRLFSGPITQRRTQTGRQLRRRHLDIYARSFKSASGRQFKKAEYNPMNNLAVNMVGNRNRTDRYVDFEEMEYVLKRHLLSEAERNIYQIPKE